jgi:hypothetical protein
MALKCCSCDEIQIEAGEFHELRSSETFNESQGRVYIRTLVASGMCPDCFASMVSDVGEMIPAA